VNRIRPLPLADQLHAFLTHNVLLRTEHLLTVALMTSRILSLLTMLIVVVLAGASPARADIIFYTGIEGGNQGTSNVVFNGVNDVLTGTTIIGNLKDGPQVSFIGDENLFVPSGGQARIEAFDGSFTDLQIFLTDPPGGTFTKAIFNLDALEDGNLTIGVVEGNGNSTFAQFALGKSGSNFFTTIATNGQDIRNVTVHSDVPLNDIEQIRFGGEAVADPVPEPAAVVLLGTALAGLVVLKRKRWAE
jgi:hypothetical protein